MGDGIPAASRAADAFRMVRRLGVARFEIGLSNFIIPPLKDISLNRSYFPHVMLRMEKDHASFALIRITGWTASRLAVFNCLVDLAVEELRMSHVLPHVVLGFKYPASACSLGQAQSCNAAQCKICQNWFGQHRQIYNHGHRFMLGSALPLILLRTIAGKINPLVLTSIKIMMNYFSP